ncbi:hypothetical protein ABZT17_15680 [Streptomyces sp. NPDC005648]|uniref:hypothetical protein n=1 Tax=Streptomyces sp. NPDC005648 TaxID=3157044 RepID=UPI0033AA7867
MSACGTTRDPYGDLVESAAAGGALPDLLDCATASRVHGRGRPPTRRSPPPSAAAAKIMLQGAPVRTTFDAAAEAVAKDLTAHEGYPWQGS